MHTQRRPARCRSTTSRTPAPTVWHWVQCPIQRTCKARAWDPLPLGSTKGLSQSACRARRKACLPANGAPLHAARQSANWTESHPTRQTFAAGAAPPPRATRESLRIRARSRRTLSSGRTASWGRPQQLHVGSAGGMPSQTQATVTAVSLLYYATVR